MTDEPQVRPGADEDLTDEELQARIQSLDPYAPFRSEYNAETDGDWGVWWNTESTRIQVELRRWKAQLSPEELEAHERQTKEHQRLLTVQHARARQPKFRRKRK